MKIHQFILSQGSKLCKFYGYNQVDLNLVEREEVFNRTLGDTSDIINTVSLSARPYDATLQRLTSDST